MFYLLQASGEPFNWQQLLFGEHSGSFLPEIAMRTMIMYIVILAGLRLTGKRGVRQLSVFELVVIIGLGSAAGDPMFYKDTGLVNAIAVFLVVIALYRLTTYLTARSKRFEELVEGKTVCLIEDGKFCYDSFDREDLAQDEFFSELRVKGVSQLGQVERGYLEVSGEVSVFFYEDKDVKTGLPILLHEYREQFAAVPATGSYACAYCGQVEQVQKGKGYECPVCKKNKWVKGSSRKRVA